MQRAAALSPLSEEARDTHVEPLRARILPGREFVWDPLQATVTDDLTDLDYNHYINRSNYRKGYAKDDPLYAYLKPKCDPPAYDDENKLKWKHKIVDISPENDGGILKMVEKRGTFQDPFIPSPDDLVSILFTAYVKHCNVPFDSTVMRQRPYVFPLRVGAVVDSLRVAVASMAEGEISRFLFKPSHFVRLFPRGLGDRVPAESDVIFDIQLVHIQCYTTHAPNTADYYAMSLEARKDAPVTMLLHVAITEQDQCEEISYPNNWKLHYYLRTLVFLEEIALRCRQDYSLSSFEALNIFAEHVNVASITCKLGYFESSLKHIVKAFRVLIFLKDIGKAYRKHRHIYHNKLRCDASYTTFDDKLVEVAQYYLELATNSKDGVTGWYMREICNVLRTIINHEKGVSGSKCPSDKNRDSWRDVFVDKFTNPSEIVDESDDQGIEISDELSLQQMCTYSTDNQLGSDVTYEDKDIHVYNHPPFSNENNAIHHTHDGYGDDSHSPSSEGHESDRDSCESGTTATLFEPQWDNVDDVDRHKPPEQPAAAHEEDRD